MSTTTPPCRSCGTDGLLPFLDLGSTPLSDALVPPERADQADDEYPLEVTFCPTCAMVQITETLPEDVLFPDDYPYFSSFSDHLLRHSREHAEGLVASRGLDGSSLVLELASNDGYLLKNFVEAGVPVLGIDPAPAQVAQANRDGVRSRCAFFGRGLAGELRDEFGAADVIIANNVMAHIPDLNGFVAGMAHMLADDGIITVENPWVHDLIEHGEFDTMYHEHIFYHSCIGVEALMNRHGLHINHVEHFADLHGGTLRYHISHHEGRSPEAKEFFATEYGAGLDTFAYYDGFAHRVEAIRDELVGLLTRLRDEGASVAAYGAAAKGSTLLNYAGIDRSLVSFVVDRNTHKQGLHMPGTHQPIFDPAVLLERSPDYLLLLAWNFADEIMAQQTEYASAGGRFIRPIPTPEIITP